MMDLGQLHKTTEYKNQGTPYSLTRTITENGQPDILFHCTQMLKSFTSTKEAPNFISTIIILTVTKAILF